MVSNKRFISSESPISFKEKKYLFLRKKDLNDLLSYLQKNFEKEEETFPDGEIIFFQRSLSSIRKEQHEKEIRELNKIRTFVQENQTETFSEKLFSLIKEKNMTQTECYEKALIDRRLFSKIRSDKNYQPKKTTVLSFVFALKLNKTQAEELLFCAGYSLTPSSHFDLIILYFLEKNIHDVFLINEALFAFEFPLLGSNPHKKEI